MKIYVSCISDMQSNDEWPRFHFRFRNLYLKIEFIQLGFGRNTGLGRDLYIHNAQLSVSPSRSYHIPLFPVHTKGTMSNQEYRCQVAVRTGSVTPHAFSIAIDQQALLGLVACEGKDLSLTVLLGQFWRGMHNHDNRVD